MPAFRGIQLFEDHFNRAQTLSSTPGQNGWTILDTSSAGTPTYVLSTSDGGQAVITLASDDEAENVALCHNDVLQFDIDRLLYMRFIAKVAAVGATNVITMGLGTARAVDEDTMTNNCWFKMEGATSTSNIVVETDDGTTDNDDVATGQTLSSTAKLFEIDFSFGKSDIRFSIDGKRVAAGTTFSMAAASGQLQPYFAADKSGAGTDSSVPALTISYVQIAQRFAK